eukprot:TRINITY_DN2635_c0_g1_i3.p1 TRINITY_DN2635_c0_g1~~TRINITY_DN2635_c0_g1_i3.p1  ORF type:complete len:501 (+),score=103.61 TRINITY_DN2635_c0_g1_i3:762-2264(+)
MLKVTTTDHRDYNPLITSLHDLDLITQKVNRGIEQAEGFSKVVGVQHQLANILPEEVSTLVTPGRWFVREGLVQFCNFDSRNHKQYKNHWLFLFNDALLFARYKPDKEERFSNCKILFFSDGFNCKNIEDLEVAKNLFFIISEKKIVTVRCSSVEEKKKWMDDLLHHSSHTSENLKSLASTLTSSPKFFPLSDTQTHKLSVNITGVATRTVKNKEFTVYIIKVTQHLRGQNQEWTINRRFRDFYILRKMLEHKYIDAKKLMELPQKHLLGNFHKETIESRRIMLQCFLEELLVNSGLCRQPEVVSFFDLPPEHSDDELSLSSPLSLEPPPTRTRRKTLERLLEGLKSKHASIQSYHSESTPLMNQRPSRSYNPSSSQESESTPELIAPAGESIMISSGLALTALRKEEKKKSHNNKRFTNAYCDDSSDSTESPIMSAPPSSTARRRKSISAPSSPPRDGSREGTPDWFKNTNTYRILNPTEEPVAANSKLRPHAHLKTAM